MYLVNRITLISIVFATAVIAHADDEADINPLYELELNVTPYPYNTDSTGNDLPVEIGRFSVPINHASPQESSKIELGYVRYPAGDDQGLPPIVFISADADINNKRLTLFSQLRLFTDVVVFDRRGFGLSSAMPPCPTRISYPFDKELGREQLAELTRSHADECLEHLANVVAAPQYFSARETALDLRDLARVLQVQSMTLVAEQGMTSEAIAAIDANRSTVDRVILVTPWIPGSLREANVVSLLLQLDARRQTSPEQSLLRQFRAMSATLATEPVIMPTETASGRVVSLTIGDFDLAMTVARLVTVASSGIPALSEMLDDMVAGDLSSLASEVLKTRQWLSSPGPLALMTAANSAHEPTSAVTSDLTFALNWPVGSIALWNSTGNIRDGITNEKQPEVIVLGSNAQPGNSAASLRRIAARFDEARIIELRCLGADSSTAYQALNRALSILLSSDADAKTVNINQDCR